VIWFYGVWAIVIVLLVAVWNEHMKRRNKW